MLTSSDRKQNLKFKFNRGLLRRGLKAKGRYSFSTEDSSNDSFDSDKVEPPKKVGRPLVTKRRYNEPKPPPQTAICTEGQEWEITDIVGRKRIRKGYQYQVVWASS